MKSQTIAHLDNIWYCKIYTDEMYVWELCCNVMNDKRESADITFINANDVNCICLLR